MEKSMKTQQKWCSQRRGSAVGSEKGTEFALSEHKSGQKLMIKTAICVIF